ncbi:FadR/GntR family transcriptional regulator [Nocardiopsis lambiniae]|uniref:FCD domain-containing protein n=1 Tax=Nocardiopsis lambiniae TaxID=3075539 RepID=A0ABU2M550_9ACTN|nr:FCD domain-containing protein [Nocardiopsis sp. DSM 44743]MDT0327714.1 FCD domain-containing protein [Nocardiopsis sp. DSM 44743]
MNESSTGDPLPAEPSWRPVSRSRAYELVVDRVEEQIIGGALKVGDHLPPERELAAWLEVSRAAVREAVRTLEAHGVVRSSVGSGKGAGTVVTAMPSGALTRMLRLHVALTSFPLVDVIEARVMLERTSAALAAREADAGHLARMRAPLDAMDDVTLTREEFNEFDTRFHVAIAEAAGNRLVSDMTIAIRESMKQQVLSGFRGAEDWADLAEVLRGHHRDLLEAIEAGRGERAADLVEEHIRYAYARLPGLRAGDR